MTIIRPFIFHQCGQDLVLDPTGAIYWPARKILFITDLHLGKVSHFHQAGIAVPGQMVEQDYDRLDRLMKRYEVNYWICLGDLFHSHWNQEHYLWIDWCKNYPDTQWILIEGNHDRYIRKHYHELNMEIYPSLDLDPFYLIHDWTNASIPNNRYALSGHLHPAVRLYGRARQQIKLRCFYFLFTGAYLPAFGELTGTHIVRPQPNDKTFVIANSEVIPIDCL